MKKEKLLLWLASLSATSLIISNLLAIKLIDVLGISFDAGVILFPLTYVLGDIIMEFYGQKTGNSIAFISAFMNAFAVAVLYLAVFLPPFPEWTGQAAFSFIFSAAPRVAFASFLSYLLSSLLNNYTFARIAQGSKSLFARALGSSAIAKAVDVVVFEFVAFFGILSLSNFFLQMVAAYFTALILEAVLFIFVTRPAAKIIKNYLVK